jgi:hypothetical protein
MVNTKKYHEINPLNLPPNQPQVKMVKRWNLMGEPTLSLMKIYAFSKLKFYRIYITDHSPLF